MKYDLTKCNNLNFKLNDGTTGFIKVSPSNDVYLYSSDKREWDELRAMPGYKMIARVTNGDSAATYLAEFGLEITPREPETYNDWKVGDNIMGKYNNDKLVIKAIVNDIIFVNSTIVVTTSLFPSIFIDENYKLILTDYEQEILEAQGEKKTEFSFKEGDKVLVKDEDGSVWFFDIFDRFEEDKDHPYYCSRNVYKRCIPLNEKTWKLLGTTDEYHPDDTNNENH